MRRLEMKILKVSVALVALLLSSYAWGQPYLPDIQFNKDSGDTVSIEGLTLVVKAVHIPNVPEESVQSRLSVEIRDEDNEHWADTFNFCQRYTGTFRYSAFRMEMVNLNSMGNYWCAEREKLSVVVKSIPLVGKFQVGDELQVWAEFQWFENGWNSISNQVYLTVE
jgi:hypothetical protein